jgi:hypothetical protein
MEVIVGLAIIIAFNEWRDVKARKKAEALDARLLELSNRLLFTDQLANKIEEQRVEIAHLRAELEPMREFIAKAHTDLQTIVQEYEINGVPLGYDRGKRPAYDVIEGL